MNSDSMATGAMYLPLEDLNRDFLRSVMYTKPRSSLRAMSPVRRKPSPGRDSRVASSRLW